MFEVLRKLFRRLATTPIAVATIPVTPTLSSTPAALQATNSVPPIFVDTETTGLNQDGRDEVLEIAIVNADGTILLNTLVCPARNTAWPEAQAIHGISPQDVAGAPSWSGLLPKIASICAGKTVVFYNAPFDTSFFPTGFFQNVECAMRSYSEVNPGHSGWVKLSDAAAESGYASTGAFHRALEDALACRHIWLFGIPVLKKTYPPLTNPRITAELALEAGGRIPLVFKALFIDQLRFVAINDVCVLWTKDDREEINVYRRGTVGGTGKIATLSKADNPEIAKSLATGWKIEMGLRERSNDVLMFEVSIYRPRQPG
ncbi:3'-5' exonuclease [Xanthomonas axonopodis]